MSDISQFVYTMGCKVVVQCWFFESGKGDHFRKVEWSQMYLKSKSFDNFLESNEVIIHCEDINTWISRVTIWKVSRRYNFYFQIIMWKKESQFELSTFWDWNEIFNWNQVLHWLVWYFLCSFLHWPIPYCEWGGIWSGPNCRLMRVDDPDLLTWGGWCVVDIPYWLPPNPVFLWICKFAKDSENQKLFYLYVWSLTKNIISNKRKSSANL